MTTPKPAALEVRPRHIPQALKEVAGWVMWKWWWNGKKWTKPPYNTDGVKIDEGNPANWSDFSTALRTYQKGEFDGIGISLNALTELAGVDLDHCVHGGVIEPWALEIVKNLGGYAEISPSGGGLRVLGFGKLRNAGRKKGNVEMYDGGRYLTVTGHHLEQSAPDLVDFGKALNAEHDKIWPATSDLESTPKEREWGTGGDLAERFQALCDDDPKFRERYYSSASVGDRSDHEFHLCAKLWEEGFSEGEIRDLMDASPQTKWNFRGNDYKDATIQNAISAASAPKTAPTARRAREPFNCGVEGGDPENNFSVRFGLKPDDILKVVKWNDDDEPKEWKFSASKAELSLRTHIPLKMATWDHKSIWWCDAGVWRPDGDRLISSLCDFLGDEYSNSYWISEVLRRIRVTLGWNPVNFDVANPYLIGTKNGYTIDLRTGETRQTDPDDLISMPVNANYDPSAKCPEFLKLVVESCGNDTDRMTLIDHVAACALAVEIEYILFLLGHGSNGKKIYEAFLLDFFGLGAGEAIGMEEMTKSRFAVAFLMRARFCVGSETNPTGPQTEMMKRISGGDWISADIKNVHDRARFRPFTQLMYDSNAMPIIEDNSAGWQRRFVGVSMPFKFVDDPDPDDPLQKKADRHLLEKIASEEEKSGVLNLMIERAQEVWANLKITRRDDDTETYDKQAYSVRDFIDKFIEFYPLDRELHQESAGLLFERFETYARYTVGAIVTRKKFSAILGKDNGEISKTVRIEGMPVRGFRGLRFNQTAFDAFITGIKEGYAVTTENDIERLSNDHENDSIEDNVTFVTIFSKLKSIEERYGYSNGPCNDLLIGRVSTRSLQPLHRYNGSLDNVLGGETTVTKPLQDRYKNGFCNSLDENDAGNESFQSVEDSQTIAENLAEGAEREKSWIEHVKTPDPKPSFSEPALKDLLDESGELTPERYAVKAGGTVGAAIRQLDLAVVVYGWHKRKLGYDTFYSPENVKVGY